VHQGI
jgi:hypothetical protein